MRAAAYLHRIEEGNACRNWSQPSSLHPQREKSERVLPSPGLGHGSGQSSECLYQPIRGERTDNLELAIHQYGPALEVYTRDAFPEDGPDVEQYAMPMRAHPWGARRTI